MAFGDRWRLVWKMEMFYLFVSPYLKNNYLCFIYLKNMNLFFFILENSMHIVGEI